MDTKTFLGIEPIGQPGKADGQWAMVVKSSLVTGGQFLWGGAALAAAVSAMEQLSGRPCVGNRPVFVVCAHQRDNGD